MNIEPTIFNKILEILVPILIAGLIFFTIKIPSSIKILASKIEDFGETVNKLDRKVDDALKVFDELRVRTTKDIAELKTAVHYIDSPRKKG